MTGLLADSPDAVYGEWYDRQMKALRQSRCDRSFVDALERIAQDLGFEYCAYTMRVPVPVTAPRIVSIANYPQYWQQRYSQQNYAQVDPTLAEAARSPLPVVWSETMFAGARPLREEALAQGIAVGWSQGCRDARGVCGILSLARSQPSIAAEELRQQQPRMLWLAHAVHAVMCPRLMARLLPEASASLTTRELDVLRWTADGRTSSEVSAILHISERTVNFHINNSLAKLNATNKTAAVVKAVMLGLL